jgi:rhamnogalacturonan endolyase
MKMHHPNARALAAYFAALALVSACGSSSSGSGTDAVSAGTEVTGALPSEAGNTDTGGTNTGGTTAGDSTAGGSTTGGTGGTTTGDTTTGGATTGGTTTGGATTGGTTTGGTTTGGTTTGDTTTGGTTTGDTPTGGTTTGGTTTGGTTTTDPATDPATASFGLTESTTYYTVDTGAGLIFKIRRVDNGVSTQSVGDITSMKYNGVEYQNTSKGSQINGGFDYLYTDTSDVSVSAALVDSTHIKITVTAGQLTHYYLAKRGDPRIYMATYFTKEPNQVNESFIRYILRLPMTNLPNGPAPSNLVGNTGSIEASDIFGMANGETRSKHYSNQRLRDWSYIGATGNNVGVWVVRGNTEGMSGGPFYRSLLNQGTGSDQEITYIVNYGMQQTEPYRTSILNTYTLVFTDGSPPPAVDNSWFSGMGLTGWVGSASRGAVSGSAITGRDTAYTYTVGFANTTAQYYATASANDGSFNCPDMLPGQYTMNIYKNELVVATETVTVTAGGTVNVGSIAITGDPSTATALWRIGDWDGTPVELLNGDKVTYMHPSDSRMASWTPGAYVVGTSTARTGFPAYQWKSVNGTQEVDFTLTADQVKSYQVRIGITAAYGSGRPNIQLNNWTSSFATASSQPDSRSLTIGSYRGNNRMYTFTVPASAFVEGNNVLKIGVISGSSGTTWLSPGYSTDAVDMIPVN